MSWWTKLKNLFFIYFIFVYSMDDLFKWIILLSTPQQSIPLRRILQWHVVVEGTTKTIPSNGWTVLMETDEMKDVSLEMLSLTTIPSQLTEDATWKADSDSTHKMQEKEKIKLQIGLLMMCQILTLLNNPTMKTNLSLIFLGRTFVL